MYNTTFESDFRARTASRRSSSSVDDWTRSQSRSTCTTGGPVLVQHSYNGDISFLWENWNVDLLYTEILEQTPKIGCRENGIVTIEYIQELTRNTKFGENPFTGDFWAQVKCHFLCDLFSLSSCAGQTLDSMWCIIAPKSKDMESGKGVPFGG